MSEKRGAYSYHSVQTRSQIAKALTSSFAFTVNKQAGGQPREEVEVNQVMGLIVF